MADKSKAFDTAKAEAEEQQAAAVATAATVESGDEDDGAEEGADDAEEGSIQGQDQGQAGPATKKKKKSKRKAIKDALTGGSEGSAAALKRAVDSLPADQIAELMKMNPALAQELSSEQATGSTSGAVGSSEATLDALKRLSLQDIMTGLASSGKNVKDMASYKFWQTQPVPKFGDGEPGEAQEGPIKQLTIDDVAKEPPKLVDGFEWDAMDLTEPEQLKEVYELLNYHYVEDEQAMFRFKYSPSMLKW